jgi:hypothetical protein
MLRYRPFVFVLSLAALPAIAAAQEQTTPPSAANRAANTVEQPVTQALNNSVQEVTSVRDAITAEQQAQYDLDRAAYRESVRAHVAGARANAAIAAQDSARAQQQEDAYARAMIAWRGQTDACKRGVLKECKKPTPMPADFY